VLIAVLIASSGRNLVPHQNKEAKDEKKCLINPHGKTSVCVSRGT